MDDVGALCSAGSRAVGEPRAGTAPHARLWVLVEQPGAWGRDAVVESHLPPGVATALKALSARAPVRVGLIRATGTHADIAPSRRTVLVARTDRSASWLTSRVVDDVTSLLDVDVDGCLQAAEPPAELPGRHDDHVDAALLVCTNARRDRCCALLGRPLAEELAQVAEGTTTAVWETSHLGGHRFAPTFLSLPDGYLFGGPDAAGRTVDACRGRSSLVPAAQAAELAVLRDAGAGSPRALRVREGADRDEWVVETADSTYTVRVRAHDGPERPESCTRPAVPSHWYRTTVTPGA